MRRNTQNGTTITPVRLSASIMRTDLEMITEGWSERYPDKHARIKDLYKCLSKKQRDGESG